MKRKRQFTNRILSLVLAMAMVLSMLPAINMTAYAATEVKNLGENTYTPYTDGLTQYFTHDSYLYQATFTNLKADGRTISIASYSGQLYLSILRDGGGASPDLLKDKFDNSTKVTTSDLPKEVGQSVSGYLYYIPAAISVSPANQWAVKVENPVVSIRCVSATGPQWNWASDYSSATAVFTVGEDDVCVTLDADIGAETEVCAKESQITYTASVRFNGAQYTDKQTAIGILDHDWGAMEGKPCYETCSRCDALRVVGHSVEGDRCTVCGDTIYSVLVAGKPISSRNASDVLGDGTISYDASSNTLTLRGSEVDASDLAVPALEIAEGTHTLEIYGDNKLIGSYNVECDDETDEWYGYPAISIAEGASLIISGDALATLKLEGNDFGYTTHDHIPSAAALSGGSLTVNGGSITTENSGGIRLSGDYTQTSGAVRVSYLEAQNVSVSDGILESHGWSGINPSYVDSNAGGIHGIFAQKSIAISGGTVSTSSGVLGHDGNYIGGQAVTGDEVVTHGLYALESIAVSGGTVTSTGGHGRYVIGNLGDLILGGYMEDDEVVGTPAGAALEAPRWSISDAATFICGSDSSHRSRTQACNDELCMFCGKQYIKGHSYDKTTHICSVCGKVETHTAHWIGPEIPGLENGITTFGQDFVQIIPVPENTHIKIGEVYAHDEFRASVNYTYENGVLSIAAKDIPSADISIVFNQFVEVTCHANGGKIVPDEGYPRPYDTGFAADGSYWIQEWCVSEPIYPLQNGSVIREGYTFVEWQDASGKVYPTNWTVGAMERATVDVTLYAQWKCNHTIGDVELRDNGDGTHSDYCGECGEPLDNAVKQPHDFGDNTHKCVCGKKITPEVTGPTPKENLVYDGTSQELINPGSTTGGTMQYSLDNASWNTEIPVAIMAGTHKVYYKVVGDENYEDVAAQSITVNIADKTAPTGEIKVKDNSWTSFWNNLTFGLFFKETQDVTITANDVGSGVSAIQYYLADGEKEPDELKAVSDWVDYNGTFKINPNNKCFVYSKVTDNAGNITYINSAGIVIYTDSTLDTTVKDEITYVLTKNAEQAFTLNLNGNTVAYVKIGTTVLGSDDYEVLGNMVFISDELLENLAVGEYTVTVGINPMGETFVAGDAPAEVVIPLVVEKAVVDINISDFGKVYDGTPVIAEYDISKSSDSSPAASNVSYNKKVEYKAWYEDDSAYSETAPVNAGDYMVRITVEETEKTTSATATADFTIEQKPVTVTATAPDKIYDGTVNIDTSAIEFTVSGLVGSETVGFTVKEAWYNGPNVGEDKDVSVVYNVTGDAAANYAFPTGGEWLPPDYFVEARADIKAADIASATVTLDQNTFVYDGTEHKPAVTVTFNGVMLTEGVDYRVFYSIPMKVANGKVEKWFSDHTTGVECVNVGDNYYAVVVGLGNFRTKDAFTLYANFVIEKATVTEPAIASKLYNNTVQTADISGNDFYTVEKNVGGIAKGSYDVVLKLKDSANYKWSTTDSAEVTVPFVISAAENCWTTTPAIIGWTYGEIANTPVGAAKYGEVSVEYTGTANDGTQYSSATAPTKAGSYTVTFTVEGTEDYSGLSQQVNFDISKAALTVTAEDTTATYGDAIPDYAVKYEGFKNGDDKDDLEGTLGFYGDYRQYNDVGEYEIKPYGLDSDNYEISYNFGKLIVSPKPITVTIQNATSAYGDTLAEMKATDNGIVNGDVNVYSLATDATSTSNVGKYEITGTALDGNYAITFVNGDYKITKREITITVEAKNMVVNTEFPIYTYKVEGLLGEDTLVTEPTITCNADITVVGEYDITAADADAGDNYSIKYVPAKLTVLTDNAVDAAAGYAEELKDYDPATATSEDKTALEDILDEINTILSDATITDSGKKALNEVKEQVENLIKEIEDALTEPDKSEDTTSPNTGDINNLWLWFALLFVSGAGIFGITLCDRKRKVVNKK